MLKDSNVKKTEEFNWRIQELVNPRFQFHIILKWVWHTVNI